MKLNVNLKENTFNANLYSKGFTAGMTVVQNDQDNGIFKSYDDYVNEMILIDGQEDQYNNGFLDGLSEFFL